MSLHGGLDLGGTKIQAIIVDHGHRVLGSARRPTPTSGGPPAVVQALADALNEAARAADVEPEDLDGLGVGSPGEVDAVAGTVANAKNLPDWTGRYPVAERLSSALGTYVSLGKDVQVAIDAEYRLGAGRPYGSLLGVFWGTGVGGGLILDGRPWAGRGEAGELGHMVVKLGGARCQCGRRGCVEAYAGRAAMERRARGLAARGSRTRLFKLMETRGRDRLTSGVWARALAGGDALAERLIDRAIASLGAGIASAVNLLDLEAVVVGGGLADRLGQPYVERIAAAMRPHLFANQSPPAVHLAALGDLGGALGASMLVASREPAAVA